MSNNLVTTAWAPGLIGLAVSGLMYGGSLAQSTHYAWFFPNDPTPIKLLVLFVFVAEALHLIGTTEFYWNMLVLCHRSDSPKCETDLSWGAYVAVPMNYLIAFAVQSFYCHRVWIITGYKRGITIVILFIAVLQLALGASIETIKDGSVNFLYTTPLVPLAAGVSTLCDIIITSTIFKYLWRSELRGRGRSNVIRDLFLLQGDHYLVGAPAVIISRCYVNSLLAVLNARRRIREREARQLRYATEMPTLPTIV
ncbi:hypothetical protein OG21DRAFT_391554 [Imleria badia]|nr:hypothetical protein OG21DRAFT_391554 [Imleria badia]